MRTTMAFHNKPSEPYQFSRSTDTAALASLRRIDLPFQKCVDDYQDLQCRHEPEPRLRVIKATLGALLHML